jgi:hypothetical protein
LVSRLEWVRRGGPASGENFEDYDNRRKAEIAADVVSHVESLPEKERDETIHDLVTILRNYDPRYEGHADLKTWSEIKAPTKTRDQFVAEAIRQLAQYKVMKDNTEIGYLEHIDPQEFAKRTNFYRKMYGQTESEEFGGKLEKAVRQTIAGLRDPASLTNPATARSGPLRRKH